MVATWRPISSPAPAKDNEMATVTITAIVMVTLRRRPLAVSATTNWARTSAALLCGHRGVKLSANLSGHLAGHPAGHLAGQLSAHSRRSPGPGRGSPYRRPARSRDGASSRRWPSRGWPWRRSPVLDRLPDRRAGEVADLDEA